MGSPRFSFLFRSIAAVLVVTTLTLAVGEHATVLAAPPVSVTAAAGLRNLALPASLGRIEEFHQGTSAKTLFYIQDAHDSLEAQQNIARTVAYLVERQGVGTVYEEGYEGEVPTGKYFGEIQDPEIRKKTAFFFMDKLRIGGAEYAHINRKKDFQLIGADNIQKHLENIDWYRRTFETRRRTGRDLAALQKEIQGLADRHFPKEVKDWMKLRKRFDGGEIALLDYLKRTLNLAGGDPSRYPYIRLILDAEHTQDKRVMREVENLSPVLLFGEIRRLEDDLSDAALSSARDRQAFGFYRDLEMIRRLSALEVSSDEYAAAKEFLAKVKTADIAGFIVKASGQPAVFSNRWEENLKSAARFYETAHARDEAIRGRLAEFAQDPHARSAALVFGGFHKNSIRAMLKEAGVSYAIITPAMKSGPEAKHQKYYRDLMSVGRHAFEIPESVRRGAAAERLWEQSWQNAGAEAAVRSEILLVAEVIRKKGAGAGVVAIDRAAMGVLQSAAARSEARKPFGEVLEEHAAEIHGQTIAEVARITTRSRPWVSTYLKLHPKVKKRFAIARGTPGRPSKVPALLEKFRQAIDGLTLYDAAIVMNFNRALLIKYADANPEILVEYNLNPRTRAEKTTQDLLAEKGRRVYGKNLTEVAGLIGRDLSTVSRYFDKYPDDLDTFHIRKNEAHGKVGRPRELKSGKRARSEMRGVEDLDEAVKRAGLDPLEDWQLKLVLEAGQLRSASKARLDRENAKLLIRLGALGFVFHLGVGLGGNLAGLFKSAVVLWTVLDLLYHSLQVAMKIHQAGWRFGKFLFLGKAPQHEFHPSAWTWKRIIQTALVFNMSALLLTVGLVIVRFAGRLPQGNPWLEYLLAVSLVLTLTQAQFIRLVYADINEWNQTPGTIWNNIVHAERAAREFSNAGLLPEAAKLSGFDNQFTDLDGQVRTRNPNFPGPDKNSFYVLVEEPAGLAVYRVQDETWFQWMHHRELAERETFLYEVSGVLEGAVPYLIQGKQTQKSVEVSDGTLYSIYKIDLPPQILARLSSRPARAEMRSDASPKEWPVKMDDKHRFYLPAALKAWREKFSAGIKVWPVQDQLALRIYPLSGWQAFWERFEAQGQTLPFLQRQRKERIFLARTGSAELDGQNRIVFPTDFVNVTKLNGASFIKPGAWILIEREDHLELRLSARAEMRRERSPGTSVNSAEPRSEMRVNLATVDATRRRLIREMEAIESSTDNVEAVRSAFTKIFLSDAVLSESLFSLPQNPEERAGYQAVMRLQLHDLARAIFFGVYEEAKSADKARYTLDFPAFLDRFLAAFSVRQPEKLPAAANQALLEIQAMFDLPLAVRQRIAAENLEKAQMLANHYRGDSREITPRSFEAGFDQVSDAVGHFSAAIRRYALEYGTPETLVAFQQFQLEYASQLQAAAEHAEDMRRLPKPPRLTPDEDAMRVDLRSAIDRFFTRVSDQDSDWILGDALESAESQILLYGVIGEDEPERPWILQLEREARAAVFAAVQTAASEVFTTSPSTLSFSDGDTVMKTLFTSLYRRVEKLKPRVIYNAYIPQLQKTPALARRWKQDRAEINSYIRDYLKVLTQEIEFYVSPSESKGRTASGQDWFRHMRFRNEFHRLFAEATRRWMNEQPAGNVDHAVHAFLYEWLTGAKGEEPLPKDPKILRFPKRSEARKPIDDGTSIVKHAWPKTMMALAGGLLGIGAALSASSILYGFWRYFENDPEGMNLGFYHYPLHFMLGSALVALPLMAGAFILDRILSLWNVWRSWALVQKSIAPEAQPSNAEPVPSRPGVDLSKPALEEDAAVPGNVEILDFPKLFEQVIPPDGFELEHDGHKIVLGHDGGPFLKVAVRGRSDGQTFGVPEASHDKKSVLELAVNWEVLGGPDERWVVMLQWDPAANQMIFNRVMVIKQPGVMELDKMGSAEMPRAFILFAPEQNAAEISEFEKEFSAGSDFSEKFTDFLRWWAQMRYLRGPVRGLVREILSPQFLQLEFVSGEQLVIRPVREGVMDITWVPPHLEARPLSFALEWLQLNHFRFLLFNDQGQETLRAEPKVISQYGLHDLPIHLSFSSGRFEINLPANPEAVDAALPPLEMRRMLKAGGMDFSSRVRFSGRGFSRSEMRGAKEDPWELAGEVSERAYRLHGLVSRMETLPSWMLYSLALTADLLSDRYDVLKEKQPDFNAGVYLSSLSAQQERVQRQYRQLVQTIERRDEKSPAILNQLLASLGGVLAFMTPYILAAFFVGMIVLGIHISFPIRRWFKIQNAPLPRFMLPVLTGAKDFDDELKVLEEPVAKLIFLQPELHRKPIREVLSLIHGARWIETRLAAILMEQIETWKKGESFENYDRLRLVTVQFRHLAENTLTRRTHWIGTSLSFLPGLLILWTLLERHFVLAVITGVLAVLFSLRIYDVIVREIVSRSPLPWFIRNLIPLKVRLGIKSSGAKPRPFRVEQWSMKHVKNMSPQLLVKSLFGMAGRKEIGTPHTSFLMDVVEAESARVYMSYGPHGLFWVERKDDVTGGMLEDAQVKEARSLYFRGHFSLKKNTETGALAPILAFKPPYLFEEVYPEAKSLIIRADLEAGLYEDLRRTVQFLLDGGLAPDTPFYLQEFNRVTNIREALAQHLPKDKKTDSYETTLGEFLKSMPPLLNAARSELRNFPKWRGKLSSPVMIYPAAGVDIATVAAFLKKFPELNKVVLVDSGYGSLSGSDFRNEIARRLRRERFGIATAELERLMRGSFDESGRLSIHARVPRKGLGPLRGIGRRIELVFYAADYLEWKRGAEKDEPAGLTVLKRPGLGGLMGHATFGGEIFYKRVLGQVAPLGLIYLHDSMTPPAHFFKEERLEILEPSAGVEPKLREPFHLLDDYALLRKNHFKDLAEFNHSWKFFNFGDVDFGFVGHDVENTVRILDSQRKGLYWTLVSHFHWWGHWGAAFIFLDALHFLVAGLLSLGSFAFKSVRESYRNFYEDFRFRWASALTDAYRDRSRTTGRADFMLAWLFKKLDGGDDRYWEHAYRAILAASLNLPGLREGLKFRREDLVSKVSPDLLRLLDEENPRIVENALFALIHQENLQRLFAKQAAASNGVARAGQSPNASGTPLGPDVLRSEMRTSDGDKPKQLGLVQYYDPSLFTSDEEYFKGRTSMPAVLTAKGVQLADYGTVIYPASGNYESGLLVILKEHIFPNVREYHLDSASYDPRFAAYDSLAGGKVTAGELVAKNIRDGIGRFSPDAISVHLYHADYYQTEFDLEQAPGKRIWIDKGPGRDARMRYDPNFYLSTLRRGLVRPGDLVLAVPYAGTEIGKFWHKKIAEGVYVPTYRDWANWTVFEVTKKDFTAVGLPVPESVRSEMREQKIMRKPFVTSLENLHGKYAIVTDIATFNALKPEEQSEYYRLFEAYREGGEVKFVFNAATADEKMSIPEALAFFDKRYDNVLINRMPAARLSFNDEGRRVITVSRQGIQPVFSRFVETARADAGKLLRVQYQSARSAQGLLSAALLTFELGEPLAFTRVLTDVPALWLAAVTDFLAAYQVFGIAA